MKIEQIKDKLEQLKNGSVTEWKLNAGVFANEIIVRYEHPEWMMWFDGKLDDPREGDCDPTDIDSVAEYLYEWGVTEIKTESMYAAYERVEVKTDENGQHYVEGQAWDKTIYQLYPGDHSQHRFVVINRKGKREWVGCPNSNYRYYYDPLCMEWEYFVETKHLEYVQKVANSIKKEDLTVGLNRKGEEFVSYFDSETETIFEITKSVEGWYLCNFESPDREGFGTTAYEEYQPIFDKLMKLQGWQFLTRV